VPTEVDVDRFNGTLADLDAFAKGGAAPPPAGSCPYGNGLYCGGNAVGGNPLKLYQCTNGSLTVVKSCALGCERMPVGCDPSTLYSCSAGTLTKITTCANGCEPMPVGYNDVCN